MSEPYVGQVIAVGFPFAPVGWALCDGSLLAINQYTALYALIGTTYGGNGTSTFALPDLRGRAVICQGQGGGLQPYVPGQSGGTEAVALTAGQFAAHAHSMTGAGSVSASDPASNLVFGTSQAEVLLYLASGGSSALSANTVSPAPGQGLPHENRQPLLTINYIIALVGVFPPHP